MSDERQPSDRRDSVVPSSPPNGAGAPSAAAADRHGRPDGLSEVELVLPEGDAFDPVARLVAAGVGTRTGLGVDRIEDLQLALEAIRHRPSGHRETTRLSFIPEGHTLQVDVEPHGEDDEARALERVVSLLVSEVWSDGAGSDRRLVLRVANPSASGGR